MKYFLVIIFILTGRHTLYAQRDSTIGTIAGNIVDENTLKAIVGATCTIYKVNDTARKRTQVADEDGGFNFEKLPFGYYTVKIAALNYRKLVIDSIFLRSERNDFNLPDLKMTRNAIDLEQVIIYAEKPLIENKDGKIVFNTSESALSNASNATDLLKQTPLVNVDADGKVQMRGKEVKILVDDKPVELNAQQLQDLLESMPGSMIEKIEVLTTPPPQYATERGGVINIVTKKGKVGFSGRLNANFGTRGEAGGGGNISYRRNKVTFNFNASISYNEYEGSGYSNRINKFQDSTNYFNTVSSSASDIRRFSNRLSLDYEINKQHTVGFVSTLNLNKNNGTSLTDYENINRYDSLYKISNRDIDNHSSVSSPAATVSYTVKGKKNSAQVFRAISSYSYTGTKSQRVFYQKYLNTDYSYSGKDSTQQQQTNISNSVFSTRLSYDVPLGDLWYISTGANSAFYRTNNLLNTYFLLKPDNVMALSQKMSNDFDFFQDVYAARFSARYKIKNAFFVTAGLQQEYSTTWFQIKDTAENYRNDYFSTLPFASITGKWQEKYSATISYKRSVQRPGINNLNPSIDYSDPYNTRFGNPMLQPYYANNFDLILGYNNKIYNINFSAGYNSLKKIFSHIRSLQPDGKTILTWENLSGRKEYEASVWGGVNISKKLKMNTSVGYVYNIYSNFDKMKNRFVDGGSFTSNVNGNYTLSPLINFTGNFSYNRFANPQGRVRNALSMNVGAQKKFFNKKLVLSVNIIDPFHNQENRNYTYGPNYELESYSTTQSRNYKLALAYNFNKMKKKGGAKKNVVPKSK